jgi:uncharacterized protein (DUF58 family)
MVRREEQPRQSRATVLLDSRAQAHRGEGAGSSFEWAVEAAASVGAHLAGRGYGVRLVTAEGPVGPSGAGPDLPGTEPRGVLLDELAVVSTVPATSLEQAAAGLRRGGGLLVAVLGALDLEQAVALARAHHAPSPAVAVLLDVGTWTSLPPRLRAPLEQGATDAARLLASAGWRVVRAGSGDDLARLWPQAARGAAGAAAAAPPPAAPEAPPSSAPPVPPAGGATRAPSVPGARR